MFNVLQPEGWAPAKGYANGIEARGRMVFVAGMIGWNGQGQFETDDFIAQCRHFDIHRLPGPHLSHLLLRHLRYRPLHCWGRRGRHWHHLNRFFQKSRGCDGPTARWLEGTN